MVYLVYLLRIWVPLGGLDGRRAMHTAYRYRHACHQWLKRIIRVEANSAGLICNAPSVSTSYAAPLSHHTGWRSSRALMQSRPICLVSIHCSNGDRRVEQLAQHGSVIASLGRELMAHESVHNLDAAVI